MSTSINFDSPEIRDLQARLPGFSIEARPYDLGESIRLFIVDLTRRLGFAILVSPVELRNPVCRGAIAYAVTPEEPTPWD